MLKLFVLIILFLVVLNLVIGNETREPFEGTGLPTQLVPGQANAEFLPVGFNSPHEVVKDAGIDSFSELNNRIRIMTQQLPTLSEADVPNPTEFQIGKSQVQQVPSETVKEIRQTISERMNNVWNMHAPGDGKWDAVNVLETRTFSTTSGIDKIIVNINMMEEKRILSKDFVIELVKLPGIKIFQILKANVAADGKQQSQVENILRGPDPLASKFYNVMNTFLNGELSKEQRTQALAEKQKMLAVPGFVCFGSKNPGAKTREECEATGGYWDQPVQASEECPFFKANENYPNERGGARGTGYCELPLGMQPLGFRGIRSSEDAKPLCYNCIKGFDDAPNSLGLCCEEQKNRGLYPTMRTPDYAFSGDQLDRQREQNTLKFRGLSWHRRGPDFENTGPIKMDSASLSGISLKAQLEQQCQQYGIPIAGCTEAEVQRISKEKSLPKQQ